MLINNKYNIKDTVYLKSDPDQFKRIVTALIIKQDDISYELALGSSSSWHYDFEITKEKDILITTNN